MTGAAAFAQVIPLLPPDWVTKSASPMTASIVSSRVAPLDVSRRNRKLTVPGMTLTTALLLLWRSVLLNVQFTDPGSMLVS